MRIKRATHILLSLVLFFSPKAESLAGAPLSDQESLPFIRYYVIGQKDGLSENKIQSIVKDSLGTFWVGTTKGLNRVFEKRIVSYDTPLLKNKIIHFIARDRKDNLWVSASNGLFLYDYGTDSFGRISVEGKATAHPEWFCDIESGMVFCSSEGISRYSYADKRFEMLIPRVWSQPPYNGFAMVSDSVAIVTSHDGLVKRLNIHSGEESTIHDFHESIYVKDIIIDGKGRAWLAVYGKGLFCLSTGNGAMVAAFKQGMSFFSDSIILDLTVRGEKLWIATDGDGVFVMDTNDFHTDNLNDLIKPELPQESASVNTVFLSGEELWLGTIRHGIILPSATYVKTFGGNDFGTYQNNGPNRSIVNCVKEDESGRLWISTDGGGIFSFDRENGEIIPVEAFKRQKVVSLEPVDKRRLLISVYNKGIYEYDTVTGKTTYVPILDEKTNENTLAQDIVINLEKNADGKILVLSRRIYLYDKELRRVKDSGIDVSGVNNFQIAHSDSLCTYVYTHYELIRVDNKDSKAERVYFSSSGDINCVRYLDGDLFMVKAFDLARLKIGKAELEEIPFKYGGKLLPVMETDGKGRLWLATREYVIRFDPSDNSYVKLDEANGVTYNDFIEGTALRSSDGDIFFGGNSGLCQVNAGRKIPSPKVQRICLLRVNVDGKNIEYTVNRDGSPSINVPWNYESMYFDIATDGGEILKSNDFRYTITGQGKQSVIYSKNRLSLPVLAAGKYDIDIAFADNTDKWMDSGSSVSIVVTPPWWKNIALAAGFLLLSAIGVLVWTWRYNNREREKAERLYRERKEKLSENKLRFLINISHELRTPLTLVYSPLKRLLERNSFTDEVESELKRVLSQSKYMNQLISTVLDSTKLEEGFGKLIITCHDLPSWTDNMIGEFKTEYENKSISLRKRFSPEVKELNFDESKFRIVLSNLLMNAWKYSEPGTAVVIAAETIGDKTRISVIDEGIGIPEENTDRIFNRFEQGDSHHNGFGLGLAYTKLLVEAHPGGSVGACRNEGKGSTFWFEIQSGLPCETVDSVQVDFTENYASPSCGEKTSVPRVDTSGHTLLIVEDEPDLLAFMKREMKGFFKEILTATKGDEALEIARKHVPSIIVSDVLMPGMNGYELCGRIKNDIDISHVPVILLTAQTGQAERDAGYKSGADIFLTKPFDIPVLLDAIRNTLSSRQLVKERYKDAFSSISSRESTFSDADERFMLKLDKYIADNIGDYSLNAQLIIDHMCMGRATFYKKVKEITGLGIMEYVTGKKMQVSEKLLRTTNLPIADIATRVGYPDSQYFSKVFKQNFNVTPRAFRNNLGKESDGSRGE